MPACAIGDEIRLRRMHQHRQILRRRGVGDDLPIDSGSEGALELRDP